MSIVLLSLTLLCRLLALLTWCCFFIFLNNLYALAGFCVILTYCWLFLCRGSVCPSNFFLLSSYKLWTYGHTLPVGKVKHISVAVLFFLTFLNVLFWYIKFDKFKSFQSSKVLHVFFSLSNMHSWFLWYITAFEFIAMKIVRNSLVVYCWK